ncbi:MAG: ATP-dependent DNA helicase [Deltaproteobacteria bacterium]|nr:MAG: ATP-dependent DNA helicase [Deltaproteobacteria bacterium]
MAGESSSVGKVLGEGGSLSRILPGYEPRPQQVEMAEAVAEAFDEGTRVVIEAATGTGKTLAYLLPALLSGKRTVVSTATKTLQDQILRKDIPLLRRVVGRPFEAVLLKGRRNYVCLDRVETFRQAPRFRTPGDRVHWGMIEAWVERTGSGDRAEVAQVPEDAPLWTELTVGAEACRGRECPHHAECFVVRARASAAEADLVVVNHHLFFADLALRDRTGVELLPSFEALVFDEAHHLEEIATGFFGLQVSNWRFADLLGDIRRMLRELAGPGAGSAGALPGVASAARADLDAVRAAAVTELEKAVNRADVEVNTFFDALAEAAGAEELRTGLAEVLDTPAGQRALAHEDAVHAAMGALRGRVMAASTGEAGARLSERIATLSAELARLLAREDDDLAWILERRGRGVFLLGLPVVLRPHFQELLLPVCDTQVYTSATLATDGNFAFFRSRTGLPADTAELLLPSVFDYMHQSLLYVPQGLPQPGAPTFIDDVAPEIERLVGLTEGRAFLLFTSYRNMRRAHALLAPRIPHRVLLQGEAERGALLEAFRADTHSVLFATSSFWEGVDVQGEALSLVVIDKLPFGSPADPLLRARSTHLETAGLNGFAHLSVPLAVLALKQGFGRLIRHRTDRGIVAILDERLVTRGYGRRFLDSLPRARRTRDFDLVRRWWASTKRED